MVLLVFFTLPGSADRLVELNRLLVAMKLRGGEILGVPLGDPGAVYRALGGRSVFFPLAIDGAAEAGAAYMLFRRDLTAQGLRPEPPPVSHMELLVDRQGYLRARWIPRELGQDRRRAGATWASSSPRSTAWRARSPSPRWRPSTCTDAT